MATELVESNGSGSGSERDTMFMLGGVALVVFGAGLILSNPYVRRFLSRFGAGNIAGAVIPDVERYFRLRAM